MCCFQRAKKKTRKCFFFFFRLFLSQNSKKKKRKISLSPLFSHQPGRQRREHAQGRARDPVHRRQRERHEDGRGDAEAGDDRRLVPEGQAEDDVGGRARAARVGDVLDGRVAVGGEVLGGDADGEAA